MEANLDAIPVYIPVLECWIYTLAIYMVTVALQRLQNEIEMGYGLPAQCWKIWARVGGHCQIIPNVVYHADMASGQLASIDSA